MTKSVRRSRFFPADVPLARRFCRSFVLLNGIYALQPLNGAEKRRGLRSSRAQTTGAGNRHESSLSKRFPAPVAPGRFRTAETSPDNASRYEPIWVYLCDLWALVVVGILEVDGDRGGAIQLAQTICVYPIDLRLFLGAQVGLVLLASWW